MMRNSVTALRFARNPALVLESDWLPCVSRNRMTAPGAVACCDTRSEGRPAARVVGPRYAYASSAL